MTQRGYILSETDRRRINRQIERLEGAPPPSMVPDKPQQQFNAPQMYWALPPCKTGLPAAQKMFDGSTKPGIAICCLYKYDENYDRLVQVTTPLGIPTRIEVRNFYTSRTNNFFQVWQHKNGYWTGERPAESNALGTTTRDPNSFPDGYVPPNSECEGSCLWTSTADLRWAGPIGGCRDRTTTSTTTSTTTAAPSTSPPGTTATTTTRCPTRDCRLKCVALASTTTAFPNQVPAPSTGYSYQVIGTTCSPPCSCYGAGDPCYVANAEIASRCIYITLTTTTSPTTTTSAPLTGNNACAKIAAYIGNPVGGIYRAARNIVGPGGWQICQNCPDLQHPYEQIGAKDPVQPQPNADVVYHESICMSSPCDRAFVVGTTFVPTTIPPSNTALYVAYAFDELVASFGGLENALKYIKIDNDKFTPDWQICSSCLPGFRPSQPPLDFLYIDPAKNASAPISLVPNAGGVYTVRSGCIPGPSCDDCGYSSPYTDKKVVELPLTTTPSPTTRRPCGCEPPLKCPTIAGECVKTVCRSGGAQGTPLCPSTTPLAGTWCQEGCIACHCNATGTGAPTSTTPAPPCGGVCSKVVISEWGCVESLNRLCIEYGITRKWVHYENTCTGNCWCTLYPQYWGLPTGTTTPHPPCGTIESVPCDRYGGPVGTTVPPNPCTKCLGYCLYHPAAGPINPGLNNLFWTHVNRAILQCMVGSPASGVVSEGCLQYPGCIAVDDSNNANCQAKVGGSLQTPPGTSAYVTCQDSPFGPFNIDGYYATYWITPDGFCGCPRPPGKPTSYCDIRTFSCGSVNACGCCEATGCRQECTWRGNGSGGWTKVIDPCPTSCPCMSPPVDARSDDECDTMRQPCFATLVPPPTTTTGTTTTTIAPGACCYPGGSCTYGAYANCLASLGGVWMGSGVTCTGSTCIAYTTTSTTTEGPGSCCHPENPDDCSGPKMCTYTYRQYCNSIACSQFFPNTGNCPPGACGTTTTTQGPLGSCCDNGVCTNTYRGNCPPPGRWSPILCEGNPCLGACCLSCANGTQVCLNDWAKSDCLGLTSAQIQALVVGCVGAASSSWQQSNCGAYGVGYCAGSSTTSTTTSTTTTTGIPTEPPF